MSAATEPPASPPFWLPILAGLPIGLCLVVMALPVLGNGHAAAYRALYLLAFLIGIVPLTAIQRALWRRRVGGGWTALVLLVITYLMALGNNVLGGVLGLLAGWGRSPSIEWSGIFRGLEGCWLALIAFCAIHAVVAHYAELKDEQERHREARSLALDAELRALRYQLHPHFLFNTLNAISALVAEERGREACGMIAKLGDFLRATLEGTDGHEVALAEEIALTETYLALEQVRLGDRLRVRWSLGPEVLGARVPRLVLQPLVENAIRHGIALRTDPGTLDIRVAREDGRLRLCLRNDGVVPSAVSAEVERRTPGVGLPNVTERLARLYPGDHSIESRRFTDGAFEVTLDLPLRELATAGAGEAEA
jgi:two-component system sensor histidine kinase AlgZ